MFLRFLLDTGIPYYKTVRHPDKGDTPLPARDEVLRNPGDHHLSFLAFFAAAPGNREQIGYRPR